MSDGGLGLEARGLEPAAPGSRVTWLEIFFDLVYVFAFLNVSLTASAGRNPDALLRGLLILALLWFAWTTFSALGNAVRADQGIMPLYGFASVAVIFVAALTIPYAFNRRGGHAADFIFAACYLLLRGLQVGAIWYAARSNPQVRPRWLALTVPPLVSSALLLAAAFVPRAINRGDLAYAVQALLWALSIAVAYGVAAVVGNRGLPIVSPRHWADRYAQVTLIALGESFISLGIGPRLQAGLPLTWPVIYGSALGITVIASLTWAYFDMRSIVGENALHRLSGHGQTALARDAYTFLHLPMIVGISIFSLGLKDLLGAIAEPRRSLGHRVPEVDVYLLYGGVFVYLVSLLAFQLRTERWTETFQIVTRVGLLALVPAARLLPGLAALALLAAWLIAGALVNQMRLAEKRRHLRTTALEQERAVEAAETWWRHGEEVAPSRAEFRKRAKPRTPR